MERHQESGEMLPCSGESVIAWLTMVCIVCLDEEKVAKELMDCKWSL